MTRAIVPIKKAAETSGPSIKTYKKLSFISSGREEITSFGFSAGTFRRTIMTHGTTET
jgi:hypothetical protein